MAKLLIFDWDGTLCDSLERIVYCIRAAAKDCGLSEPAPEDAREIVGLGLVEALTYLFPNIDKTQVSMMRDHYSRHFVEQDVIPSPFYPGVDQTLNSLKGQGYLLAVATGKSRKGLDRVLSARGLTNFFHASRCADETASKPDPAMLHELLNQFGLPAEQALMIGDTEFDMEMSVNAGMPRIAVSYGAHAVERLHGYNPLACIDKFSDIEKEINCYKKQLTN